ncbi:oxysterol-binding protein-related protein 5 isoform X1 [Canis lupus familiaris]|uniref:Oxysterol-binding protein n=5 Tax=Canis lupus TaxID=9612 RepID=A0A8P0SFB8_CANLF|nr:oxysterol-binding protein-related protein 5 isoform X1 [Canis lupus familiaris]XP_038310085.1 oxysterol-binding protein-related protein 5 isoform X1 [Canis lupus familiaris]XP_038419540.1 oxysterol-binding protein-related protein 5 isoform X1 [Canis lupus familiaris]XP_048952361.1 oxysterol-binding protein-related protein 5 isoform X2 [Canis lupus dingo]
MPCCTKPPSAQAMKEEAFLRRRFSLCPPSSTPQKVDPRKLSRNLLFGGENELYPLSPGKDMEPNGPSLPRDEGPPTPSSATKGPPAEYRLYNGSDKECVSPTAKVTKKEALKVQKENYRQEKKRATRQLFSALTDPSVVIMADSLKIRGTLKSWTKLWCVLKPGVLLIYKTPKVGQWVGTVLLHCCELIERPSKKDGFCFKLFHPLDQSVWAVKGPKGESVGSITQPLPSSYLIFRAASESDGRCWLDALELALRCSSLLRLSTCKQGRDGEPGSSPDASPPSLCGLPSSAAIHDQDLCPLNGSSLENDAFSDKSERENAEESDNETQDHSGKTNESGGAHSETLEGRLPRRTTYVEQVHEEFGELGQASQVETVSEENKSLMWVLLRQLRPGMDLSRVVLPTFVLEPRSFLDKLSDYYYHADLLSRAALEGDAYSRIKLVLQWYLSGFYKKPKGIKKPYNPILGETFRCCWFHPQTNSHTFYIAEQVSHHPPVSAFHVSNRKDGFCISGSITAKSRFYGNSLSALLDGKATLTFLNRAEDYTLTMPYAHCKGILYGTMTMELGGRVTIECEKNNFQAELEFKLKPFFGGSTSINQISGKIMSGEEVLARLTGHWDREVFIKEEGRGSTELFWNPSGEVRGQRLKRRTVLFEEQTELESERLWQHVTRAISEGDQHKATQEKFSLEEAQRQRTRERQQNLMPWKPQLFHLDPTTQEWCYRHEDRSPWDPLKDIAQFEQDGVLYTMRRETMAHQTAFLGSPGPRHQGPGPERRLRKSSDQPSGHSQVTESSSTPESCPELSDEEEEEEEDGDFIPGSESPCPRCGKEARRLQALHEAIVSIREAQQELHRHLSAMLSSTARARQVAAPGLLQSPRSWFLLCVFLACQLLINYILK